MQFIVLFFGISCIILSLSMLLSSKVVSFMADNFWKENDSELERKMFPGKYGYFVRRYLSSVAMLAMGVFLLVLFWFMI